MKRFEVHSHSDYSNFTILDSINKIPNLINRAIEIGLSGIALTDHETIAGAPEAMFYMESLQDKHPEFKLAIGNEIYLCPNRDMGQKYYHFILIAKNKDGWRALRELSTRAWLNSFWDRGLERRVTTYQDLEEIITKYPNSLIASTACLGGELSTLVSKMMSAEQTFDVIGREQYHDKIVNFLLWCKKIFGNDFYIECAPGCSQEQIIVNKKLADIAYVFNIKMVIGSDAHYLKKEDRFVHKAYLNSKGGERETDAFYQYSYLQTEEEIYNNLSKSFDYTEFIEGMFCNSMEIYNKIERYSIRHKQQIPKVEVIDYPKVNKIGLEKFPIIRNMFTSDDKVSRYWINQCYDKLAAKGKLNEIYLARLEEEADIKKTISEKLENNMFGYPVALQHYIDLFWDCGSIVGAGRGSSCSGLNHYLLGVTQLDPIEYELPFWRYLNKDRIELGDIDIDLCPSKRPLILQKIKEERAKDFNADVDNLSRANLGCTLIATYGTEGTKSAILTACRGYRSEEFPDGIDVDSAQYMASLVPSERGFLWTIDEVVNGNADKDRKPVTTFINEVNKYPGLLNIITAIESLINKRSSHASGVILFDEDPYEFGAFMRTPTGDIITQFDLHSCEALGMTKFDFLVTDVQDKLTETIHLLQKYNVIENDLTLRQVYDKYFHPEVLPIDEKIYWKQIQEGNVLNIFQFDSDVGAQAAKKIRPSSILELADANGLMRLMTSEKGAETPMDKYIRFKNNINLWYKEMADYGLNQEQVEVLKPYFLKSHGVPPSQEQMMLMLMDPDICDFSLKDANSARKIVGKKQMSKIPELQAQVFAQAKTPEIGRYVWEAGIQTQLGYSFSIIHALAYSFIGFQTAYIATRWNPIYWNTACLIVNSGALENNTEEEIVGIYEPESDDLKEGYEFIDLPDKSGKIKKKKVSTNYEKTAKALGEIISRGIKVSYIDINQSEFSFEPDVENNQILFGLKALAGVNDSAIDQIKAGRPYKSLKDFMSRCPLNKTQMISLIKAGAFDKTESVWAKTHNIEPRKWAMIYYLMNNCDAKNKLNLQNFSGLMQKNLIPDALTYNKQVFEFNKYLKAYTKTGQYFVFDEACSAFYNKHYDIDLLEVINGLTCIKQKTWDKIYQKEMDGARDWLKENQNEVLNQYNTILFNEVWDKYAKGNISSWEMESMCFYYHEHELSNVNMAKYGISDFFCLPEQPEVDYYFKRKGQEIPVWKTHKIIGTVISKNDTKATISLLTTSGVVNVKFTKEYYAAYKRRISEIGEDEKKHTLEDGWFKRGTLLMITGYRRDDQFVSKTYKNTLTHQIYKITLENNGRDMVLVHERADMEDENE